jgi:hypothetical protein
MTINLSRGHQEIDYAALYHLLYTFWMLISLSVMVSDR